MLELWYVFASIGGINLRDPTTAVYDPISCSWHVYCTSIPGSQGQEGYPGSIRHFSCAGSLEAGPASGPGQAWQDQGLVLEPTRAEGDFDASGVFTPGVVRDCAPAAACRGEQCCVWLLFYGGVRNQSDGHVEMIGLALADSPFGPFERHANNPVFTFLDGCSDWCGADGPARVDEVKPLLVDGQKLIVVKSVCKNFTALPVLYRPLNQRSWRPPYAVVPSPRSPLFEARNTCQRKGFEEPTLFEAPDGFLHFIGHNHGQCGEDRKYAHFISLKRNVLNWLQAPAFGGNFMEPVPIPAAGDGVFGREIGAQWIDFSGWNLSFHNVSWEWGELPKAEEA